MWTRSRELVPWPNLFDCAKVQSQMAQFHKTTNQRMPQRACIFKSYTPSPLYPSHPSSFLPLYLIPPSLSFSLHPNYLILTTNLAECVCVCAKCDPFLPSRFHFFFKLPEFFFRIAKFPYAAFGPLFAFHCPKLFTKNNTLNGVCMLNVTAAH